MKYLFGFIILLMTGLVTGCGTLHYQEKEEFVGMATRLQTDDESKPKASAISLQNLRVSGNMLLVEVVQDVQVKEIEYEKYQRYGQDSQEPTLLFIINPLTWLVCVVKPKDCFGYTGEWEPTGMPMERNVRFTGRLVTEQRPVTAPGVVEAYIFAKSESAKALNSAEKMTFSGQSYKLDLKQKLETLSARPLEALVILAAKHEDIVESQNIALDQHQLAKLKLESERWLPVDEQQRRYFSRLKVALQKGDHKEALIQYGELERILSPLPDAFYYHVAVSLSAIGDKQAAQRYAKRYLQETKHQRYAKEAQLLL